MLANIVPVATGDNWVGYGVRSFRSIISELIKSANTEILMTAYLLTNRDIITEIETALKRGVNVTIYLYDDRKKITKTEAVKSAFKLTEEFPYLFIKVVKNKVLHAKILIVDGKKTLVGSANLTQPAMLSNYELGFVVEDPTISGQITDLIRRMDKI